MEKNKEDGHTIKKKKIQSALQFLNSTLKA